MRRFIRHPSRMPIEYWRRPAEPHHRQPMRDIGGGGLCFEAASALEVGSRIHVRVPVGRPPFEAEGVVVWCRPRGGDFVVGVRFDDAQVHYALRMVEQLCYIEQYRNDVMTREGRHLDPEEAASEWIEKFAHTFPG